MKDLIIDKLRKIKQLAERGTDGERTAAVRMFDELCRKHGIRPETLREERLERCNLTFRGDVERTLIGNVVGYVTGRAIGSMRGRIEKTKIIILLPPLERIAVEDCWAHYRREWRKALRVSVDDLSIAFVSKYRLFTPNTNVSDDSESCTFDVERLERLRSMMNGLKGDHWANRKRLTCGAAR